MKAYGQFGMCVCAAVMAGALGCAEDVDGADTTSGSTVCTLVGTSWWNQSFPEQTGRFHVELSATPSGSNIDAVVGLSNATATKWTSLAAIVRFNPSGFVDARAGSEYRSDISMPYQAGVAYSIRIDVDVARHTYSVSVGDAQIARDYPFRTEQASVTRLGNLSSFVNPETGPGTLQVCGIAVNAAASTGNGCVASDAGRGFTSYAVAPSQDTMIVDVAARASIEPMDGVVGLASGTVDAYNDLAASIRFWTNGYMEARDGDTYRADAVLAYTPGATYKLKFVVDIINKTYSVYVDDPATDYDAVALARNYRFRPQQATVTTLDHVATVVASSTGHVDACDPKNVVSNALVFAREGSYWMTPTTNDGIVISGGLNGPGPTYRLDAQGRVAASLTTSSGPMATDTAGNIYMISGWSQYAPTITSYTPNFAVRWSRTISTNGWVNSIGVTSGGIVIVQAGTGVYTIAADGASDHYVYGWTTYGADRVAIGRPGFVHSWWQADGGVILSSFRPDGTMYWSRRINGDFEVHALAMAPDGSTVFVGQFFSDIDFGDGLMTMASNENGPRNTFLLALDPAGNFRFSKRLVANDANYVATNGHLIVTSNRNHDTSAHLTLQVFDTAGNSIHDWIDEGFGLGQYGNTFDVALTDGGRLYAQLAVGPWYPTDGKGFFFLLSLKP